MRIRFLGHSACEITDGTTTLLVDPFITGNPVCPISAEELSPNYILLTHFHGDHVGDTVPIAKRCGAEVITTYEGAPDLEGQGLTVHTMALGGKQKFPFGMVRVTMAFHGSGAAGAHAAGFVLHIGGKRIYHAGDTALFSDMKLLNGVIEEPGIDVALLPIGDKYTMGPDDAIIATHWIGPKVVIPIHYDTFPFLKQDAEAWASQISAKTDTRPVILRPGETFEF